VEIQLPSFDGLFSVMELTGPEIDRCPGYAFGGAFSVEPGGRGGCTTWAPSACGASRVSTT
jgi:hypothetical protein